MRVFVTGGTGFIGSHVVARLARTGHQAHCLVRSSSKVGALEQHHASWSLGDVTDREAVLAGMRGCDWVFHLANVYSFWEPDVRVYRKVNVEGTRTVLEAALETGVRKVVHVSSVVSFGKPADCPFTEQSQPGPMRFSQYAQTKYEGDRIAWELYESRGLPLVVIYPGAVLGPGDPKPTGQYLSQLVHRRLPAAVFTNRVMTFVHVRDVAEAICRAAEHEGNLGQKYLVGASRLSFGEINHMVATIAGVQLPRITLPEPVTQVNAVLLTGLARLTKHPPPWGMSRDQIRTMKAGFQFDGSKAVRELGIDYTPIRTAIEEAIASLRDQRGGL